MDYVFSVNDSVDDKRGHGLESNNGHDGLESYRHAAFLSPEAGLDRPANSILSTDFDNPIGYLEEGQRQLGKPDGFELAKREFEKAIKAADAIDQKEVSKELERVDRILEERELNRFQRKDWLQYKAHLEDMHMAPGFTRANLAFLYIKHGRRRFDSMAMELLRKGVSVVPAMWNDPNFQKHYRKLLGNSPLYPGRPQERSERKPEPVRPNKKPSVLPESPVKKPEPKKEVKPEKKVHHEQNGEPEKKEQTPEKKPENADAKEEEKKQALDLLIGANQAYETAGTLSSEIRQQFEAAISQADKQTGFFKKGVDAYEKEIESWLGANSAKIKQAESRLKEKLAALSPDDRTKVQNLLNKMQQKQTDFQREIAGLPADQRVKREHEFNQTRRKEAEQVEKLAPGLLNALAEYKKYDATYQAALQELAQLNELTRLSGNARLSYGVALFREGEEDSACEQFRKAILEHGASPYAILQLAQQEAGTDAEKAYVYYKAAVLASDSITTAEAADLVRPDRDKLRQATKAIEEKLNKAIIKYGDESASVILEENDGKNPDQIRKIQAIKKQLMEAAVRADDQEIIGYLQVIAQNNALQQGLDDQLKLPVATRYMLGLHLNKMGRNSEAREQFKESAAILSLGIPMDSSSNPLQHLTDYVSKLVDGSGPDPERRIRLAPDKLMPVLVDVAAADRIAAAGKVITDRNHFAQKSIDFTNKIKDKSDVRLFGITSIVELPDTINPRIPSFLLPDAYNKNHAQAVATLAGALEADREHTEAALNSLTKNATAVVSDVAQDIGVSMISLSIARRLATRLPGFWGKAAGVAFVYGAGGLMREGTDSLSAWVLGTPDRSLTENFFRQSIATTAVFAGDRAFKWKQNSIAAKLGADELNALARRAGVTLPEGVSGMAAYRHIMAGAEARMLQVEEAAKLGQAAGQMPLRQNGWFSFLNYPYRYLANPFGKVNLGSGATLRSISAHVGAKNFYQNLVVGGSFGAVYSGGHNVYDVLRGAKNPETSQPYTWNDAAKKTLNDTIGASVTAGLAGPFLRMSWGFTRTTFGLPKYLPGVRPLAGWLGRGLQSRFQSGSGRIAGSVFAQNLQARGRQFIAGAPQWLGAVGAEGQAVAGQFKALTIPSLLGSANISYKAWQGYNQAGRWKSLLLEAQGLSAEREAKRKKIAETPDDTAMPE